MMDALTAQSRVRTRVLQTDEHWFGLTYQDDQARRRCGAARPAR